MASAIVEPWSRFETLTNDLDHGFFPQFRKPGLKFLVDNFVVNLLLYLRRDLLYGPLMLDIALEPAWALVTFST